MCVDITVCVVVEWTRLLILCACVWGSLVHLIPACLPTHCQENSLWYSVFFVCLHSSQSETWLNILLKHMWLVVAERGSKPLPTQQPCRHHHHWGASGAVPHCLILTVSHNDTLAWLILSMWSIVILIWNLSFKKILEYDFLKMWLYSSRSFCSDRCMQNSALYVHIYYRKSDSSVVLCVLNFFLNPHNFMQKYIIIYFAIT